MRTVAVQALAALLAGCAAVAAPQVREAPVAQAQVAEPPCPAGQERMQTAQLFFGRSVAGKATLSTADFQQFVDQELTPRFPDGLTVMDGGGAWRGSENQLIRDASKVVLIVMPKRSDAPARIDAVRDAYRKRFNEETVLLVTQASCVSF
jgi:hypothetical protein